MVRTTTRRKASKEKTLHTRRTHCPTCRKTMWSAYVSHRTVSTLKGVHQIHLHVRRCRSPSCARYHKAFRPEAEGRIALPQHEFGLDVIALIGALRYQQHRSVPEIHQALLVRGLRICQRTVTNLLDRYDELVSVRLSDSRRLQTITKKQGRVILALDGLQPDVGHEVLWVLRDCLSGEVLLARSLLSSTERDLAGLIREVKRNLSVPIVGAISDGQHSIRKAASPSLVLRGSVRIVAGLGTRSRRFQGKELAPAQLETWQTLRAGLESRRHTHTLRQRFRRDPEVYLRQLEALLLKRTLPP